MRTSLPGAFLAILPAAVIFSSSLRADTYVGLRAWEAQWSPGIIRAQERRTEILNYYNYLSGGKNYEVVIASTDSAGGAYGGPLVSYVTENRRWSFSAVALEGRSNLSSISTLHVLETPQIGSVPGSYGSFADSQSTRPVRNDLDATVGYALTERVKLFAGVKGQSYRYELESTTFGTINDASTSQEFHFKMGGRGHTILSHRYSGAAMGVAYALPVSDTGAITGSLGVFAARGRATTDSTLLISAGSTLNIFQGQRNTSGLHMSAATYELAYTSRVTEDLFFQWGFRGQASHLVLEKSANADETNITNGAGTVTRRVLPRNEIRDTFSGLTFSVITRL